jgi:excisionase family DNA binding protein
MATPTPNGSARAPGRDRTLDPDALTEADLSRLRRVLRRLDASAAADSGRERSLPLRFGGGQGEEGVALPASLSRVIAEALEQVAAGRRVHLAADSDEMTTQEAADFLAVSRPYLVGLLEDGDIPFHKVGTHRRVRFDDALTYRREMRASQEEAFAALTRQAQELGMGYELDEDDAAKENQNAQ